MGQFYFITVLASAQFPFASAHILVVHSSLVHILVVRSSSAHITYIIMFSPGRILFPVVSRRSACMRAFGSLRAEEHHEPYSSNSFDRRMLSQQQGTQHFLTAAKAHLADFEFFGMPSDSTVAILMRKREAGDADWAGLSMRAVDGAAKSQQRLCKFGPLRQEVLHTQPLGFIFSNIHDATDPQTGWWLKQVSDFAAHASPRNGAWNVSFQPKSGVPVHELCEQLRNNYEASAILQLRGDVSGRFLRTKSEWLLHARPNHKKRRLRMLLGQLIMTPGFDDLSFPLVGQRSDFRYNCLLRGRRTLLRVVPNPRLRERFQSSSVNFCRWDGRRAHALGRPCVLTTLSTML